MSDPKVWEFVHIALVLATGLRVGGFADFCKFRMGTGVDWLHFQSLKPDRSRDKGNFAIFIYEMAGIADFENGDCAPKPHVSCVVHCFVFGHRFVYPKVAHNLGLRRAVSRCTSARTEGVSIQMSPCVGMHGASGGSLPWFASYCKIPPTAGR